MSAFYDHRTAAAAPRCGSSGLHLGSLDDVKMREGSL
jgi:hypothetical protein